MVVLSVQLTPLIRLVELPLFVGLLKLPFIMVSGNMTMLEKFMEELKSTHKPRQNLPLNKMSLKKSNLLNMKNSKMTRKHIEGLFNHNSPGRTFRKTAAPAAGGG